MVCTFWKDFFNEVIRLRNDSPIAIHFVDPEAVGELNQQVQFIQKIMTETMEFFAKKLDRPTEGLVKNLLEKLKTNIDAKELVDWLIKWLKNIKP